MADEYLFVRKTHQHNVQDCQSSSQDQRESDAPEALTQRPQRHCSYPG